MSTQKQSELTHDEVWDDSELVDSWNDALEEYKKYHSLASRGEKVNIKSKAEAIILNGTNISTQTPSSSAPVNFIGPAPPPPSSTAQATPGSSSKLGQANTSSVMAPPGLASLPQTLLGSGQDETLKNIMVSWYYAGYYTGLYEGQQKAWADMQSMQETG